MVAARKDFLDSQHLASHDAAHAFIGEWLLDRVSGLVDAGAVTVRRLRIDERALHVELRFAASGSPQTLTAELNGDTAEARNDAASCNVQALLEGDGLVWEFECRSPRHCARVRRVMHSSKQGTQLVTERVDLNDEGMPTALRTEYWTRAGQHASSEH